MGAAFEFFVGFNMIFSPDSLLNGHKPKPGMETIAFEWFGTACILFGITLIMVGKPMRFANLIYQLTWVASLGSTFLGRPWRPESAVTDGSWATVPFGAHAFFGLAALLAVLQGPGDDKKKAA